MKCFHCATEAISKETNHIEDLGDCIIIVRHVPSWVCPDCGEVMYTATVAKELERLTKAARDMMTEIAVINYPAQIA